MATAKATTPAMRVVRARNWEEARSIPPPVRQPDAQRGQETLFLRCTSRCIAIGRLEIARMLLAGKAAVNVLSIWRLCWQPANRIAIICRLVADAASRRRLNCKDSPAGIAATQ